MTLTERLERLDAFIAEADEMAKKAEHASATLRGSERGPMYATLATMYNSLAALEVALYTDMRRERREEQFAFRLRTLERLQGLPEDPLKESA